MAIVKLTPQEKAQVESQGFAVRDLKHLEGERRSYYDPRTNTWTAPLHADRQRMLYYLRMGFLLEKPTGEAVQPQAEPVREMEVAEPPSPVVCPLCGKPCKDRPGMAIHIRAKHNPKKYHKKKLKGGNK